MESVSETAILTSLGQDLRFILTGTLAQNYSRVNKILCNIMNRMEKYFGEEYEFTPLSYMLPEEEDLLDEDMIKYKDMWYIAKPSKGCGGEGIFLVNRITDIPRWHSTSELLVQHYITDPLLVDKKKFDLRMYVLTVGLDPLECYF